MKLESLRMHGFKSFADSTEIRFHEGITTIVGPNGCGKSNISDAIRWVLGEQRPTAIRGAKMEEAIFQGSVNRRPVGRGSVTMVVDNEDGSLPVPFEQVEIGRRVYRDGGSDYSLNRSVVRLKDVVDLVRDTGLGANAYNVLENRMIEAILSDRAEERRALFEEASGTGRYKDRRKAATRRLERAEADLQRLEDVIAEVESKVRSLARQKGKAQRYLALRARRLSVEVAVVGRRLKELRTRKAELEKELSGDAATGEGVAAELQAAEARYETLRLEEAEVERARAGAAARLEEVRSELTRWEREMAVAAERTSYAERRLGQIDEERAAAAERAATLEEEEEALAARAEEKEAEARASKASLDRVRETADGIRARLDEQREAYQRLQAEEHGLARRAAQLAGDAEAADAQALELGRRLSKLEAELEGAAKELGELDQQGDLFTGRLDETRERREQAASEVAAAAEGLRAAKEKLEAAEAEDLEASERLAARSGELAALEALERDAVGVALPVKALLQAGVEGIEGVLADFIEAPESLAGAVEAFLGPLIQGVVVADRAATERVRSWFEGEWSGGGGLVILPLDAVPSETDGGTLLDRVGTSGEGAPWVRALLSGVDLVEEGQVVEASGGVALAPSGAYRDGLGVVRVGRAGGTSGTLERRQRLERLRKDARECEEAARAARAKREARRRDVVTAEEALEEARARLRDAEDADRGARAEMSDRQDRRGRLDDRRADLARQIEGTRATRSRTLQRAAEARKEREELEAEERRVAERRERQRAEVDARQVEWDEVAREESAIAVVAARAESELERARERRENAAEARRHALERIAAFDEEERALRQEIDQARALAAEGEEAMSELFEKREDAASAFAEREAELERVAEAVREAERHARELRRAEREATDRRHKLELEHQDTAGRIERIRERLEGEWGRSLETLLAEAEPLEEEDDDPEALESELREIVHKLERIGPVNMLAVEEHEEESARLEFLREQHGDLIEARADLRSAIRQIDETATELFMETFEKIRTNFRDVHRRLFEGGEADIWLGDDGDPLEAPIEIHASPRGKKTQRIHLLSGGERALTALSLLFALYLVKPSPFCVLDEVDAPLDENNIGRFIRLLEDFKDQTQFIVITHNPRTIEAADWIYGVTMEEPGVSTVVGVQLEDALERARGTAA